MDGVNNVTVQVFTNVGISTIGQLRLFTGQQLHESLENLRTTDPNVGRSVWSGRATRALAVMERVHDAIWIGAVGPPLKFQCPLCYDWLVNAIRLPNDILVCSSCITSWLDITPMNPFTRQPLNRNQLINANMYHEIQRVRHTCDRLMVRRRREIE